MERVLDTRPSRDERRAQPKFSISRRLKAVEPRRKLWAGPLQRVDQGREGACVGFAWTIEALSTPVRVKLADANEYARGFYRETLDNDEFPGNADEGTSINAGGNTARRRGLIEGFLWADTMEDVRVAVQTAGPVVVGIPWMSSMYETNERGHVIVEGDVVGGHAITLTGYTPKWWGTEWFRWRNSWGPYYGIAGDGWIRRNELEMLLEMWRQPGMPLEAALPYGRKLLAA